MHRDLPAMVASSWYCRATRVRQHADLARPSEIWLCNRSRPRLGDRQHGGAAQRHVLADGGDRRRIAPRSSPCRLGGQNRLDIAADVERDIGDHLDQTLEVIVARHEVVSELTSTIEPLSAP